MNLGYLQFKCSLTTHQSLSNVAVLHLLETRNDEGLWEGGATGDGLSTADRCGVRGQPAPLGRAGVCVGAGVMQGVGIAAKVFLQAQTDSQGGQVLEEATVDELITSCHVALDQDEEMQPLT